MPAREDITSNLAGKGIEPKQNKISPETIALKTELYYFAGILTELFQIVNLLTGLPFDTEPLFTRNANLLA